METTITENEQIDTTSRMTTEKKMEVYYTLREGLQMIDLMEQDEIDKVLTPEILAQVESIRIKWKDTKESMTNDIATLESEIKADVLAKKETINSANVMAVWVKGRTSWDGKLLEGMAKLEPKLLAAKKEGEPTVSIRFTK
mgnify:CR=1 FL=1